MVDRTFRVSLGFRWFRSLRLGQADRNSGLQDLSIVYLQYTLGGIAIGLFEGTFLSVISVLGKNTKTFASLRKQGGCCTILHMFIHFAKSDISIFLEPPLGRYALRFGKKPRGGTPAVQPCSRRVIFRLRNGRSRGDRLRNGHRRVARSVRQPNRSSRDRDWTDPVGVGRS